MKDFEYALKEFERAVQIAEDYDKDKVQVPTGAAKIALTVLKAVCEENKPEEVPEIAG